MGTSRPEVHLSSKLFPIIGKALLRHLTENGHNVLAVAVTKVHVHLLIELPNHLGKMRAIIGRVKQIASRAVRKDLPGAIWARGAKFEPVKSRAHQLRALEYIFYDQGMRAWTWSFRDGSDDGRFGRKRAAPW
jgi:REP element-mobilizing transposase RayT